MKQSIPAFALALIATSAFATPVKDQPQRPKNERVSVGVQNIFVPAEGYDDNDTIEVVVDGELPNSCYHVERTEVTVDPNNANTFVIEQFATKALDGLCVQNGKDLPVHMQSLVPFTNEVNLGRLAAGDYTVKYKGQGLRQTAQNFKVVPAPTTSIDSLPYARVSNAFVSDLTAKAKDILITLSGTLNSSCMHLEDTVNTERVKDVVVMLPTTKIDLSPICLQVIRNFSTTVNLGKMEPGRYMAHIRSHNGKAINRVFSVVEKEAE